MARTMFGGSAFLGLDFNINPLWRWYKY